MSHFDYAVRANPLVRYRTHPGEGIPGDWLGRLGVTASFDLGARPSTRVRALQTLERARERVADLHRRGIAAALLAHADLLLAQDAELAARRDLEEAEAELARARIRGPAAGGGDADPSAAGPDEELAAARHAYRTALLEHRRSQAELAAAREEAAAHGLAPRAHYEPLRFVLPDPDGVAATETHDHRILELELLEALAEIDEPHRRPLDDLRLRAAYRNRALSLDVEGGIVNGRPGATLGVDVPGGPERWELELSAQLLLDDGARELPFLRQAAAAAEAALHAYPEAFARDLERAVARARMAEEGVDLAEEALALGLGRPATLRSRLYRAWTAYVRATADALDLAGGSWEVRPEPAGPDRHQRLERQGRTRPASRSTGANPTDS